MSTEQRETLDAILRQSAFPAVSDVNEQRRQLRALLSAQPLPADVIVTAAAVSSTPSTGSPAKAAEDVRILMERTKTSSKEKSLLDIVFSS